MEEKEIGGLSFSRKPSESFTIFTSDGEIKVRAPKNLTILRDELIKKNEQQ